MHTHLYMLVITSPHVCRKIACVPERERTKESKRETERRRERDGKRERRREREK